MLVTIIGGGAMIASPPAPSDLVIAVDSGYDSAASAGVAVDVLVGDLDSISAEGLAHAEHHGVDVITLARDKDETDLSVALRLAVERGATRIELHAWDAGRLDHLLAVVLSMPSVPVETVAHLGPALVQVVRPGRATVVRGQIGDIVTLLPAGGPVSGVRTQGLHYPLSSERLEPGSTRGVSNELSEPAGAITVDDGQLLVIQPSVIQPSVIQPGAVQPGAVQPGVIQPSGGRS